SGLEVRATRALGDESAAADTVIVTGGLTFYPARSDSALVGGIRADARQARRVGSVCAGAFLLAEAGLLAGRRATTHWAGGQGLSEMYPDVHVEPDRIYIRDGEVWTSAGVTAGIDLAIAMVADDHGTELAREISRWLVVYLHRPGGQSQFSAPVAAGPPRQKPMRALQIWIEENLARDLTVDSLAR
ncbi:GlxA family transcriptional regulator, partial [Nocardia gipuzkoensis]